MAKFIVAKSNSDGGIELYPMKEWLRQHPDFIPEGMSATSSTSRQLLSALKKSGWRYEETSMEVRLFLPNEEINNSSILSLLETDEDEESCNENPSFGLERQLRDFLADNIESLSINGKKLTLFVNAEGRDGIEYPTGVGFIDVLGIDKEGNFYVFELKRDSGSDKVVGQVARYMGWVKSTIGKQKNVYGVIVAKQINSKLRYAASIIPNVSLFEYQVQFFLHEADSLDG
jgi:hypothetical protein